MCKTLLFLGGAEYQVPAIKKAVGRGYRVVVCGYRPGDPGNRIGHEYRNVSIANTAKIVELASEVNADIILGYVSETAVNTAAKVSEMLCLPGCPAGVLDKLSNKDLFRNFQKKEGFDHPQFAVLKDNEPFLLPSNLSFPLIVKPTDSCGSRGVSRIDQKKQFSDALRLALSHSAKKRVILEEVVGHGNRQLTGDGFMRGGKLEYFYMADHIYTGEKSIAAVGTSWPATLKTEMNEEIKSTLEAQLIRAGYTEGPVNADIRIGENGRIYIIEAAPRFGANYMPQIIEHCTGIDLLDVLFDSFEGVESRYCKKSSRHALSLILQSEEGGNFKGVSYSPHIQKHILKNDIFKASGSVVQPFKHLGDAIGVLILSFNTRKEKNVHMGNFRNLVEIEIKPQLQCEWTDTNEKRPN